MTWNVTACPAASFRPLAALHNTTDHERCVSNLGLKTSPTVSTSVATTTPRPAPSIPSRTIGNSLSVVRRVEQIQPRYLLPELALHTSRREIARDVPATQRQQQTLLQDLSQQ
eukprot:GFKZ01006261.1.p1 GENE.GFKZ01006261.1~~GFKZ01006261.1.p1  ORF type:complete len:113 (+),score=6.05 GFKZ01006261.1:199-537(+)